MTSLEAITDLYGRFKQAQNEAFSMITLGKFFPKPWWNADITVSRNKREDLYRTYRNNRSSLNLLNWKRKPAEHKKLLREYKRKTWQKYISEINVRTPISEVWDKIKNIKGRQKRRIMILKEGNNTYTREEEIANKMAEAFSQFSSTENYSETFKGEKLNAEAIPIPFHNDNTLLYNNEFDTQEVESVINKLRKKTAPGPD